LSSLKNHRSTNAGGDVAEIIDACLSFMTWGAGAGFGAGFGAGAGAGAGCAQAPSSTNPTINSEITHNKTFFIFGLHSFLV
jgi:hypothetical protein